MHAASPVAPPGSMASRWGNLRADQLRELLGAFGLPSDGAKSALLERLASQTIAQHVDRCTGYGMALRAAAAADGSSSMSASAPPFVPRGGAAAAPTGPSTVAMCKAAIISLKERNGSSLPAIKKFVLATYGKV